MSDAGRHRAQALDENVTLRREATALAAKAVDGLWPGGKSSHDQNAAIVRDALLELAATAYAEGQQVERAAWKAKCIIEVAVDNPSVSDYMTHWEGRALKAEAALAAAEGQAGLKAGWCSRCELNRLSSTGACPECGTVLQPRDCDGTLVERLVHEAVQLEPTDPKRQVMHEAAKALEGGPSEASFADVARLTEQALAISQILAHAGIGGGTSLVEGVRQLWIQRDKPRADNPYAVFEPWIVKRPRGGCTVEFPLSKFDELVDTVLSTYTSDDEAVQLEAEIDRLKGLWSVQQDRALRAEDECKSLQQDIVRLRAALAAAEGTQSEDDDCPQCAHWKDAHQTEMERCLVQEARADAAEAAVEATNNRLANAQGQIDYMCQEIANTLGLPVASSPAEAVGAVRDLMAGAERWKAALAAAEGPPAKEREEAMLAIRREAQEWRDRVNELQREQREDVARWNKANTENLQALKAAEARVDAARAEEREACAKMAENAEDVCDCADRIAAAIRARGEEASRG